MPHKNGGVIYDRVIDAFGEVLLQLRHRVSNILGELDCVGARRLENRDGDGGSIIEQRSQRIAGSAKFEPGDVFEQNLFAMGPGFDHDLAEFLSGNKSALGVDLQFEIYRRADWLLSDGAG